MSMWNHLKADRLLDALFGQADPKANAHLLECEECRRLLEEAREGLALAPKAVVPEPGPHYFSAFRKHVSGKIASGRTFRWSMGPALAAAAVVVVALGVFVRPVPRPRAAEAHLAAWTTPLPPADQDTGLALIQALAPASEDLVPVSGCVSVSDCVLGLSDDESGALLERMKTDMTGSQL
jgi:hypothetical protein